MKPYTRQRLMDVKAKLRNIDELVEGVSKLSVAGNDVVGRKLDLAAYLAKIALDEMEFSIQELDGE